MKKEPLKIGISVGMLRGQRMFETPVEHPPMSFDKANEFIHREFDPGFSLFFVDESNKRRRRGRRRE